MRKVAIITVLIAGAAGGWALFSSAAPTTRFDLVIRNGRIVDGTGNPWFSGDVGIVGERIAQIGSLADALATRTIDAHGYVISPGFYDMHCHSDVALLADGRNEPKVRQGVTFELLAETESMAPLTGRYLEDRSRGLLRQGIRVDWTTVHGYYDRLKRQGISTNVATLVGAGTLRMNVLGHEKRPPTAAELRRMEELLAQAMEDGAAGLMGALVNPPGSFAATGEITALARVAARYGGIYSTHVRGENETVVDAFREAIQIGRAARLPVEVVHIKAAGRPNWGLMRESVDVILEARAQGVDITADIYPWPAMHHSMVNAVPNWAHDGGREKMLARLRSPEDRARIKKEMQDGGDPSWWNISKSVDGLSGIVITRVPNRPEQFVGRNMDEIAKMIGATDPRDAILDFLLLQDGDVSAMWFAMSEEDIAYAMKQPWCSICSDGSPAGPGGRAHPRYYGTFPRVLRKYVREDRVLPLEDAIRKMTSLPAQRLGHRDRGQIRPGFFADLVLFKPESVAERATFEDPEQFPVGIDYVLVNGTVVIDQGRHTGATPGKVLSGPGVRRKTS
ncbi:MAG: D-aminoacylase [Acidobacteria bacterium]|nr:D-aminoacylase [Acidobacteriota bacterium]